jgi:EAL domain-containing protein (putative c-di-GMP-specific phosphodiesterase class I)
MGADVFAIMIPAITSIDDVARQVESQLRFYFDKPFQLGESELHVSAKVGIGIYPDDGTEAEMLFANAEAALASAKVSGESYLFHTPQMTELVAEHLDLENRLRRAIERAEFVLHYQPKVDFKRQAVDRVEALIRWNDPASGLVPPGKFIPLLEQTGLIKAVGSWVLRQVVSDINRWRAMGLKSPRVAVNVSPIQLREKKFVNEVLDAMAGLGDAEPLIDIEITESMVMDNIQQVHTTLQTLRGVGVQVSIDDFGTGYSSLAYLARLPINILKIDRAFILGLGQDDGCIAIVSAIISLAHLLKLKVIAEGVETEEQAEILKRLKCDLMQGYLFSKPLPFEELAALLPPATVMSYERGSDA